MDTQLLLLIIFGVSLASFIIEKKVLWLTYFSAVCLIVMIALFLSAFKIIPSQHSMYDFFTGPAVPFILACMILALDLKDFRYVPPTIILIFGVGTVATVVGGLVAAVVGSVDQGADAAKIAAQLTASYIGGGENAVAMQKILDIAPEKFVACFAVDNIVTSIWMVVTIVLARNSFEGDKDRDKESERLMLDGCPAKIIDFLVTIFCALATTALANLCSNKLGFLHPLLYLSGIALLVGQIPVIKRHLRQSYMLGSLAFAPFFFSIGAISDLYAIASVPRTILIMPFIVVIVHALIIFSAAKMLKIKRGETCLASQSLIGGAGTAVALAQAVQWRTGVSLGMILGITGYAIANYFGVMVYHVSNSLIKLMGV